MPDPLTTLAGVAAIGIPALIVLWLVLRRQARAIFLFGVALLLVGLGYIAGTGAAADVGRAVMGMVAPAAKVAAPGR